MDEQSAPKNADSNYRSQRGMFERWCAAMARVTKPCTTATYVEYIASQGHGPGPGTLAISVEGPVWCNSEATVVRINRCPVGQLLIPCVVT